MDLYKSLGDRDVKSGPQRYAGLAAVETCLVGHTYCTLLLRRRSLLWGLLALFVLSALLHTSAVRRLPMQMLCLTRGQERSNLHLAASLDRSSDPLAQVFTRYAAWHRQNRHSRNVGVLVWKPCVPLHSGLGDNVRGAMGAYVLAVVLRRVLFLDVDSAPFFQQVAPASFDWRYNSSALAHKASLDTPTLNLAYETKERGIDLAAIKERLRGHRVARIEMCELDTAQSVDRWLLRRDSSKSSLAVLTSLRRSYGLSALRALPIDHSVREYGWDKGHLYRDLFSTTDEMNDRVTELSRTLNLAVGEAYSSIHLRIGHGLREQRHTRFSRWRDLRNLSTCLAASTVLAYENTVSATQPVARWRSKPPVFYLATDTPQIFEFLKADIAELWPGARLVMAPFNAVHSGHYPTIESAVSTWQDLLLLSRGTHIFVGIPSGFANIAGWISEKPKYHLGPCTDRGIGAFAKRETREIAQMVNV